MKTARPFGLVMLCGSILCGRAVAGGAAAAPNAPALAARPAAIIAALRHRGAEDSAAVLVGALEAVFAADWSEAKKQERCVALVAYAVAAKGKEAAPMMRIVASGVPPAWLPLIAATAVVAAGDNSPAVAKAMLEAVAVDPQASEACRAACANPSTVLLPTEMGIIRGITLPTPSEAPSKAPPLPTILRSAEKYLGQ